jgi:hypothetical protein
MVYIDDEIQTPVLEHPNVFNVFIQSLSHSLKHPIIQSGALYYQLNMSWRLSREDPIFFVSFDYKSNSDTSTWNMCTQSSRYIGNIGDACPNLQKAFKTEFDHCVQNKGILQFRLPWPQSTHERIALKKMCAGHLQRTEENQSL